MSFYIYSPPYIYSCYVAPSVCMFIRIYLSVYIFLCIYNLSFALFPYVYSVRVCSLHVNDVSVYLLLMHVFLFSYFFICISPLCIYPFIHTSLRVHIPSVYISPCVYPLCVFLPPCVCMIVVGI